MTIAQAPPKSIFSSIERQRDQHREDDVLLRREFGLDVQLREQRQLGEQRVTPATAATPGTPGTPGTRARHRPTTTTTPRPVGAVRVGQGLQSAARRRGPLQPRRVALGVARPRPRRASVVAGSSGSRCPSSSATFAGQPSTCVTVTVRGKGGKYCVTKQGILSYSGSSSSSYFELTKYSSKPPASLFKPPRRSDHRNACPGVRFRSP